MIMCVEALQSANAGADRRVAAWTEPTDYDTAACLHSCNILTIAHTDTVLDSDLCLADIVGKLGSSTTCHGISRTQWYYCGKYYILRLSDTAAQQRHYGTYVAPARAETVPPGTGRTRPARLVSIHNSLPQPMVSTYLQLRKSKSNSYK